MSEKYCEHCDTDHTCREDIIECYGGQIDKLEAEKESYKRKLIEALEKWQHKDSSLNGYYEILNFIKQWEPDEN